MPTTHDVTAQRIAAMKGVPYNRGPGPDIQALFEVIEVETIKTIGEARRQLRGYRCPVYVAGADAAATRVALMYYSGTDIGVMDPFGKILKSSTRPSYHDRLRNLTR